MTRFAYDQSHLEAQMQAQIAQGLNAELAVPCPDCGVESGRACRDSLDRAVRTHLARSVAANRRDTEPCPAPDAPVEKLCANCSQPLGYGTKILGNVVIGWHCGDCWSSVNLWDPEQSRTLDQRIREAQPDDATECAWSTPTSEGEGWR